MRTAFTYGLHSVSLRAQTGIISSATFTEIITHCNFSDVGPFVTCESCITPPHTSGMHTCCVHVHMHTAMRGRALVPGADCSSAISQASKEMGNINLYDIYVEMCLGQEEDGEHFGNGGLSAARK